MMHILDAWIGRGNAYFLQLQLDSAVEDFREAVRLGCADAEVFTKIAQIYACWGELPEAEKILQEGRKRVAEPESLDIVLIPYSLTLNGLDLHDLSELPRWDMIQRLSISDAEISDLSPIAQLSNLTELNLVGNNITSTSFLSQSDQIKILDLSENRVVDLAPLASMQNLEVLHLSYNPDLEDLVPLEGCRSLKELYLGYTSVQNLEPLTSLSDLKRLQISFATDIVDFTPPLTLDHLNYISCYGLSEDATNYLKSNFPDAFILDEDYSKTR